MVCDLGSRVSGLEFRLINDLYHNAILDQAAIW